MKQFLKDKLTVKIMDSRAEMGRVAAEDIREVLSRLLSEKEEVNMIFAAAPSQNEVLAGLCEFTDLAWDRVNAFHMDEYIGLPKSAPQCFSNFLVDHIFSKLPFKSVNLICSENGAEEECARYTALLAAHPCDIVVMGIGENGHIAFNDPLPISAIPPSSSPCRWTRSAAISRCMTVALKSLRMCPPTR